MEFIFKFFALVFLVAVVVNHPVMAGLLIIGYFFVSSLAGDRSKAKSKKRP